MKHRIAACILLLAAFTSYAQTSQWEFKFGPRFWGVAVAGRYLIAPPSVTGVETSVTGLVSTAGESAGYFRYEDGAQYTLPVPLDSPQAASYEGIAAYRRYDLLWQLGIQQGLVPRDDTAADKAVAFGFFRGQYDLARREDEYVLFPGAANAGGEEELFFRDRPRDAYANLRGSLVGGLAYSTVVLNEVTRQRAGLEAELSFEWGPRFLLNDVLSSANYTRTTLLAKGFLPLYEAEPRGSRNVFSSHLAALAIVDWAAGDQIPLEIRQTTGGRSIRDAPGGSIRGYAPGRFGSTFKALGNVELRFSLPSIANPQVVPGLILYTDAAYFHDAEQTSPVAGENEGFLLSSGAAISVYLDIVLAFDLVFYTNYLWLEPSYQDESWVPFGLGFGLHF